MLPSEILDLICSFLDLQDLVSFSQTSRELRDSIFETTYRDGLLKACPYYDLNYSQWDSWKESALHYSRVDTRPFRSNLTYPVHIDKPLPDDFECLCRGADLKSVFVYGDSGIFVEDRFVSLTQSPKAKPFTPKKMFIDSAPFGLFNEICYGDRSMHSVGDFHRANCTSQIMAAVSTYEDQLGLLVKDITDELGDPDDDPLYFARLRGRGPFRLQIVGKKVVLAITGPNGTLFSSIFTPPDGFSTLPYTKSLEILPAGMLFYDGNVFDVFMSLSKSPVVQSTKSKSSTPSVWKLNRYHKVEQDERHPQYALIYNQHGVATALVDLKQHKVQNFSEVSETTQSFGAWPSSRSPWAPEEQHVVMVGLSKGSVGVWKYSEKYLANKYMSQHRLRQPLEMAGAFRAAEDDSHDIFSHSALHSFTERFAGLNIPSWPGDD
ncbi:hypothetical protein CJU89_1820 [Yarrowia sp. B02]|nr:hypothetical protein CJU89_1820 [Yarrowia sp. B02]